MSFGKVRKYNSTLKSWRKWKETSITTRLITRKRRVEPEICAAMERPGLALLFLKTVVRLFVDLFFSSSFCQL